MHTKISGKQFQLLAAVAKIAQLHIYRSTKLKKFQYFTEMYTYFTQVPHNFIRSS